MTLIIASILVTVEVQSLSFFSKNKSVACKHHSLKANAFDLLADMFSAEDDGMYHRHRLRSFHSYEL